jgi:hypothetical protein
MLRHVIVTWLLIAWGIEIRDLNGGRLPGEKIRDKLLTGSTTKHIGRLRRVSICC